MTNSNNDANIHINNEINTRGKLEMNQINNDKIIQNELQQNFIDIDNLTRGAIDSDKFVTKKGENDVEMINDEGNNNDVYIQNDQLIAENLQKNQMAIHQITNDGTTENNVTIR